MQKRPATNTLMSYWKCAPEQHPENCHVKSIVRPPHVNDSTTDPHHFKYNKPLYAGAGMGQGSLESVVHVQCLTRYSAVYQLCTFLKSKAETKCSRGLHLAEGLESRFALASLLQLPGLLAAWCQCSGPASPVCYTSLHCSEHADRKSVV